MTMDRAGWILAFLLSSLWLLPALLALWLGHKAYAQEHFGFGGQVHSFPYRHAQYQVGVVTLWCLGMTMLAWGAAGAHALWRALRAPARPAPAILVAMPGPVSHDLEPDPVVEAYKAGVDRTLIRGRLARTPAERADDLVALARFAEELRQAGIAARRTP
jgi:hypothetical protein